MALWFKKKKKNQDTDEPSAPDHHTGTAPTEAAETVNTPTDHSQPAPTPASEPAAAEKEENNDTPKPGGFLKSLRKGLSKTRNLFSNNVDELFSGDRKMDDELLEELEELLVTSDLGVQTSTALIEKISKRIFRITGAEQMKEALKEEILSILSRRTVAPEKPAAKPLVMMVVGVNGVGKTTTIGKLAARYTQAGKKVLIAASDTFRAAAVEQLNIWAERAGAEIVRHKDGADPSAVAYDGIEAAMARESDIVIVDTAGRLHTKVNLMEELKKIQRTISKKIPEAPHETLLVLDATTGQNALSQAKLFNDAIGVTQIALTKLDGTAKGGIVVSICSTLNIPLKYIGVGETISDLQDFDPKQFADSLF